MVMITRRMAEHGKDGKKASMAKTTRRIAWHGDDHEKDSKP